MLCTCELSVPPRPRVHPSATYTSALGICRRAETNFESFRRKDHEGLSSLLGWGFNTNRRKGSDRFLRTGLQMNCSFITPSPEDGKTSTDVAPRSAYVMPILSSCFAFLVLDLFCTAAYRFCSSSLAMIDLIGPAPSKAGCAARLFW